MEADVVELRRRLPLGRNGAVEPAGREGRERHGRRRGVLVRPLVRLDRVAKRVVDVVGDGERRVGVEVASVAAPHAHGVAAQVQVLDAGADVDEVRGVARTVRQASAAHGRRVRRHVRELRDRPAEVGEAPARAHRDVVARDERAGVPADAVARVVVDRVAVDVGRPPGLVHHDRAVRRVRGVHLVEDVVPDPRQHRLHVDPGVGAGRVDDVALDVVLHRRGRPRLDRDAAVAEGPDVEAAVDLDPLDAHVVVEDSDRVAVGDGARPQPEAGARRPGVPLRRPDLARQRWREDADVVGGARGVAVDHHGVVHVPVLVAGPVELEAAGHEVRGVQVTRVRGARLRRGQQVEGAEDRDRLRNERDVGVAGGAAYGRVLDREHGRGAAARDVVAARAPADLVADADVHSCRGSERQRAGRGRGVARVKRRRLRPDRVVHRRVGHELRHEGVLRSGVVREVGTDRFRERGFRRGRVPHHVDAARRVEGDAVALLVAGPPDVGQEHERRPGRVDLAGEGILKAAVVREVGPARDRKARLGRVRGSEEEGVPREVHGHAADRVESRPAHEAAVDEAARGVELGDEAVVPTAPGLQRRARVVGGRGLADHVDVARRVAGDPDAAFERAAAEERRVDERAARGVELRDDGVGGAEVERGVVDAGAGRGKRGAVGIAGHVGAARAVDGDAVQRVEAGATEVGAVGEPGAARRDLGDEAVLAVPHLVEGGGGLGEAGRVRQRPAGHVGGASAVDRDRHAALAARAADVAAVDEPRAGRVQLQHERVVRSTVEGDVGTREHREAGGLARCGLTRHVGEPRRGHRDAAGGVVRRAADERGVDEPRAVGADLGHERVAAAVVADVERARDGGEVGRRRVADDVRGARRVDRDRVAPVAIAAAGAADEAAVGEHHGVDHEPLRRVVRAQLEAELEPIGARRVGVLARPARAGASRSERGGHLAAAAGVVLPRQGRVLLE